MNISVNVTLDASPALLAALQSLIGQPTAPTKKTSGKSALTSVPANTPTEEQTAGTTPVISDTTEVKESSAETTVEITLEQVRAEVVKLSQNGKRDELKKILTSFGAANVATLEKSKYADFLKELQKAA